MRLLFLSFLILNLSQNLFSQWETMPATNFDSGKFSEQILSVENSLFAFNFYGESRWLADNNSSVWQSSDSMPNLLMLAKKGMIWFGIGFSNPLQNSFNLFSSPDLLDWKKSDSTFTFYPIRHLLVDGDDLILMEHNGNFRRSTDDGSTWPIVGQSSNTNEYDWIADSNIIFSIKDKAIIHSKDFGLTWQEGQPIEGLFSPINSKSYAARGSKVYVNGIDTVFYSENYGQTWKANFSIFHGGGHLGSGHIIFANDDGLFLDWGLGRLIFSPDGGKNFYPAHDGLPYPIGHEEYAVSDDGTTYLLDNQGNVYRLKKGALAIFEPKNFHQISISPNPASDFSEAVFPETLEKGSVLKVFSGNGRLVQEVLVDEKQVKFSANQLAAGSYFLICKSGEKVFSGKMTVIRN